MQPLRRFVIVLFSLFLGGQLPAQSPDPDMLLDSLDTAPLEFYLDKADRQDMEDQWIRYARYGLQSALASWEREALLLMGEGFNLSEYKAEAQETLEDLLKARFAVWLSTGFFAEMEPPSLAELSEDIALLNEEYLYEKDENGDLILDTGGNVVYKTSIDFTREKELWSDGVVAAIKDLLSLWEQKMVTSGDEFLSSVSDPDVKEHLVQAYETTFSSWDENYRKELYRLYYLEQSRFAQLRLYDQRSLERITERQTAEYISSQLIAQTQMTLNGGLENLMAGLEAEATVPSGEGEATDTDKWMESFRSLLESGLLAWDKAEEELLMERIQWEQTSGVEIAKAEEAWAKSFKALQEKRSEWMDSYRRALEEGNALWGQESEALETAIEKAVVELDKSLENEKASLQCRMDNLIGMLLQSVNMLRTARTSWEYWMDQYDGGEMGSFDSSGIAFDIWDMRRASLAACLGNLGFSESEEILLFVFDRLKENADESSDFWEEVPSYDDVEAILDTYEPYQTLGDEEKAAKLIKLSETLEQLYSQIGKVLEGTHSSAGLMEAFYWVEEVFSVYQLYARDTQDTLGATYGIVVFNDESLRTAFQDDGSLNDLLTATGETSEGDGLLDGEILYNDALWEQLYLDPYQVEILKARAYMQYWQKQKIIARAVYDYAVDHSSTKEEASETEARLTETKDRYEAVLEEYRRLIEELETLGFELEERAAQMATLQQQISEAQEELSEAREELALVFADLSVNNPQFLAEQYRTYYKDLLATYGMDGQEETDGLGSSFEEYLLAVKAYGLEEEISLVSSRVLDLLSGEEDQDLDSSFFNPDTASLSVLHTKAVDAAGAGFTTDREEANERGLFFLGEQAEHEYDCYLKETLHLRMSDYRYEAMLELYDRFYHDDEAEAGVILWQMQRLVRDIQIGMQREYELRLARIRLLTCERFEDWVDAYFPDIPRKGAETAKELYALVTNGETGTPLAGVLSAVTGDMAVYEQILEGYNDFLAEGGEGTFSLYTWDPDLVCGGNETLTAYQGMQRLWEYRVKAAGGDADEAAETITLIIGAFQVLLDYLSGFGSLEEHIPEIENALLYSHYLDDFFISKGIPEEQRDSHNFLKAYLNGSGALVTDEENLGIYFRMEESADTAMRSSLVSVLGEERDKAPVLREMAADQAYASLITWLLETGLVKNDRVSLKRPETIWNENTFSAPADIVPWLMNINDGLNNIAVGLPSYVYEELAGFLGELKTYMSVRAAQTWPEGVTADPDCLNDEILALREEHGKLQNLFSRLMAEGSAGEVGKLWEIIESLENDDPLYSAASERFLKTIGFDLAYRASLADGFSGMVTEWESLLDEYLFDTGLEGREEIDTWRTGLLEAAKADYAFAEAVKTPEAVDWNSVPEEWKSTYRGGLWNSLDFNAALSNLTGTDIELLQTQAADLVTLSRKPEGNIYANILKFGLEAVLREEGGYTASDAVAVTEGFFAENGISVDDERTTDEYMALEKGSRLLWILEGTPETVEHYMKKLILTQHLKGSEIHEIVEGIEIEGLKDKLFNFLDIHETVRSYNQLLHGDISAYLKARYPGDEDRQIEIRASYERFLGSDMSRWGDPVFMIAGGLHDVPLPDILESIACNKTKGYSDILCGPDGSVVSTGGQSVNSVFLNAAGEIILARLFDPEKAAVLSEQYALKEYIVRTGDWSKSLETEEHDHWRTFLTEEYLVSEDDETGLIPDGRVDVQHEDYGRDLVIGDTGDEAAVRSYPDTHPFYQAGSEEENFLLDAANSCLDRAAFFVGALEMWNDTDIHAEPTGDEELNLFMEHLTTNPDENFRINGEEYDSLWACLESFDYSDIRKVFLYEADIATIAAYAEARKGYHGILSRIEGLKESLGLFGRRREIVQRLADAGEDEISEALRPLRDEIAALEAHIAEDQALWQDLIDREDRGYRQLEREYADTYAQAREAFEELEDAKQDYILTRAVYDYATAGYIDTGDEADDDEELDDISEEIIETLQNVKPAERLSYVQERLTRATAAYDALVTIVNGNVDTNYSIYGKDPVYRSLFDAYMTSFRESLALNKMNQVLNMAIARQETVVRKALEDWNTARRESYSPISVRNAGGDIDTSRLTDLGLGLIRNFDGTWSLHWGSGDLTDDEAVGYFEAGDDSERGLSAFEEDLVRWLSVINNLQVNNSVKREEVMAKWGMALLWEDYLEQSVLSDFDEGAFFNQYLDQVKEQNLDREGAKALLLARWEEAYNTRASGLADGQWMFDFYKLLDKSGSMSIETENGDGEADFTSFAEKESFVLANKYMAAGKKEEGRRLVLASIPVFAMAAVYYAMAIAAASILPFGWIAAIPLLAIFCFFMVKGADLAGEGNMLKAAARKIEAEAVKRENTKGLIFEAFKTDTGNIIRKQEIYEIELAKLKDMKGETEEGETLTDEERIAGLKDSVLRAFNEENENIGGLLIDAGVLSEEGTEEDSENISAALDELLGLYQGRMSESAKEKATNSQALISALEEEAVEAKWEASRELNDSLTAENGAAKKQQEACEAYRFSYLEYIRGEIEQEEFEAAAEAAFADPAFSVREHLLRLYEQQQRMAEDIMGDDQFGSDISRDLLADQEALLAGTGSAKGIIDYRQEAYREVRLFELTMLRVETSERRKQWEDQMSAIMAKGQMEWTSGTRKMRSKYETWLEDTNRAYQKQKAAWGDKYLDFLSDKQAWMEAVSIQSTRYGDEDVLKNFGEMTRSALDAAGEDVLIGDFKAYAVDPEEILLEVIDLELLETLLENARSLNSGIGKLETVIFTAKRPDEFTTADTLQAIQDFQSLKNEEFEQHIARLEFSKLLDSLSLAEERFYLQIESANESVKHGLHKTMTGDGYILEGNLYTKELVVGATISEYLEETGTVRRYQYYRPEEVDFGNELEAYEGRMESMNSESLEGLLDKAIASMEKTTEKIFGDTEDPESFLLPEDLLKNDGSRTDREGDSLSIEDYDFLQVLSGLNENGEQMETYRGVNMSPGLFGRHVGYAPGFSDEADTTLAWDAEGQIEFQGLGEMGEIMGQFIFNKIKEGYGWAEVNSPHYKKKLWDDRETWIDAPSIQDITELSTTALTIATGGTGAFFLGLVDDAVFTTADVDEGLMTWDEGLVSFGKTVAASAVNSFIPGVSTEGMSVFGAAMAAMGNRFVTNMATGVIGSLTYSSDGGWGFDGQAYADSLVGEAALSGYAGSLFSTYTSGTITGAMDGLNEGFYGSLADLGGEVAGKAAEYAVYAGFQFADDGFSDLGTSLTAAFDDMGGVSLNIANLGALLDITRLAAVKGTDAYNDQFMGGWGKAADSLAGTGLFALNFTSSGVRGRISTEGINLGGNLYDLGKGFVADMAIRNYTKENGNGNLLKYGYAYGDQALEDTIWRILTGKDSIAYDGKDGEAQTVKTTAGGRNIHLASSYKDISNKEDLFKAVTVLQHEAHRDGAMTGDNTIETLRAVLAHSSIAMELAGEYGLDFLLSDETLVKDILALMGLDGGSRSFEEYVAEAYDSQGDFWR
ncbi:MAG: hypothetical protein JW760_04885, partial [Spirochaetales bacterium]|nr:hypothetical protein [Spirochaetales bacterium]